MAAATDVRRAMCASCARRYADTLDDFDGKRVPVCFQCRDGEVAEPPPAPSTRERLLRVLRRSYGLDIVELAQALGEDTEHGRAKLSVALKRAARDGLVEYSGNRMDRIYRATARND